jgi:release factor glutamine methyltransferase
MATEIHALIDEGAARLARVAENPGHEAAILLAAALGVSRAHLVAFPGERILDCEATDRYESYVTRRALGEPVAYVLGEKEFWSLPLAVTPAVLIPRPETELVVERVLAHLPQGAEADVLDLATGSGAIALAVARERSDCRVTATDVSKDAIAVASSNARRLGLDRVEFRIGHWYTPVQDMSFDLIASNPPYIAEGDPRVEKSVQRFEPHAALYAGPTGLEAFAEIIAGAQRHLRPGGWIVLEHGDTQGAAVRGLLAGAGFEAVRTHRDLAGLERCTEGVRSSRPTP